MEASQSESRAAQPPLQDKALHQIPLAPEARAGGAGARLGSESLAAEAPAPSSRTEAEPLKAGPLFRMLLKVLAAAAAAAAVFFGMQWAESGKYFLLKRLEMSGDTQKVPLARLKDAIEPAAAGKTFFEVDLEAVHQAAETVPWVKYASVRRVWPDKLVIDVTVYEAAALYEDGRLVSTEGKLFSANPDEGAETDDLPAFSGTPEAVPEILRRWRRFSALAQPIPARVTALGFSSRGSWTATIESPEIPPTKIELGREDSGPAVEERFRLVMASYPKIVEILGGPPASIDARYRRAIAAGKTDHKLVEEHREAVLAAQERPEAEVHAGTPAALTAPDALPADESGIDTASAADDAADAAAAGAVSAEPVVHEAEPAP